jgi:hypothetical protein
MADIHGNVLCESGVDEFADRVLFGCFVMYARERRACHDLDQPARICSLGKRTKDEDVRLVSGDEVPLNVGFDVGESREGAEHGRVDACGTYMLAGST